MYEQAEFYDEVAVPLVTVVDGDGGACFNSKSIDRMREVSLVFRDNLGLKSQSFVTFSHDWPDDSLSRSASQTCSAFLLKNEQKSDQIKLMERVSMQTTKTNETES